MAAAEVLDGEVVRRWLALSAVALEKARTAIDELNVYPVPDADTGTNLHQTVACAADAVAALPAHASAAQVWRAATAAALVGACGNSGIITSQLLRGLADVCADAEPCDGGALARALAQAAAAARSAVRHPVEGTVLTVADAAALAAEPGLAAGAGLAEVASAAAAAARTALDSTPRQLAVLAANGVVDAGGAGLCVLLDELSAAVAGASPGHGPLLPFGGASQQPRAAAVTGSAAGPQPGPNAYEVTFLLEAPERAVGQLADRLDELGDSLVISGGDGQWHVHVHAADAGAVIGHALAAGQPSRVTVTYLAPPAAAPEQADRTHRAVVIAEGPALADLLGGAGALVVPVSSPVQAIAAAAVHDPQRDPVADAAAMASAAAGMRYGSVDPGPVLTGRVNGQVVAEGTAAADVAAAVAAALLRPDTELVTVVSGAAADRDLAELVAARARAVSPQAEVICYDGGMTTAILLIGAE